MSNQTGLKHAATEPTRLDNKRERRRGAAGRAAALRRAPSDSDCSGETASLSADSGDRAVRFPPPPTRSGKTRSRRRGSEWEVLEGLKDGQRFEKRPEVYNGYLHKKRKWPLKGWHKRFFVVDGGILVYARSPTDVARGRLHGSVDVGLSVISAKARRRRIDIDADEFIYHLRAKTPDVFRTWLTVLKAHRLYRQHLLTFGARESVPKIHAPLEDLPPTDTSSRTSWSSLENTIPSSFDEPQNKGSDMSPILCEIDASVYDNTTHNTVEDWTRCPDNSGLIPVNFEPLEEHEVPQVNYKNMVYNPRSLCSMNCVAMRYRKQNYNDVKSNDSPLLSLGATDTEKHVHSTDLELNSLKSMDKSKLLWKYSLNSPIKGHNTKNDLCASKSNTLHEHCTEKTSLFCDDQTACYFFSKKTANKTLPEFTMKKSKKSTNLVKYRNLTSEPKLKGPLNKCMLLGKHKKIDKSVKKESRGMTCDNISKESNEVQVTIENKEHKSLQDVMSVSEYDQIAEKLVGSIFNINRVEDDNERAQRIKVYINQVVRELYDINVNSSNVHPIKALFRCLLEYWLKNTSIETFREAMTRVISIDRQSNKYFTRDEQLSSVNISKATKETQFYGISPLHMNNTVKIITKPDKKKNYCNKQPTESYVKERRIQELERLLKNTVYICETACSSQSKEKDIKITKTLIDNLEKLSMKSTNNKSVDNILFNDSNSSAELPKIQETINHLISDTAMPADIAKDFLGAYLDILINDTKESQTSSTQSSITPKESKTNMCNLKCQVQAEPIQKKMCKSVTTTEKSIEKNTIGNEKSTKPDILLKSIKNQPVDPGQLYLKDILDKITTIFSKVKKLDSSSYIDNTRTNNKNVKCDDIKKEFVKNDELRNCKEYHGKKLIYENRDENSIVLDLSKYDLEHISMVSDPRTEGMMSITIKLKEKPANVGELQHTNLNIKFSKEQKTSIKPEIKKSTLWHLPLNTSSKATFNNMTLLEPNVYYRNPYIDLDPNIQKEKIDLKPYSSSSDATSKGYCRIIHESEHSLDVSFQSSNYYYRNVTDLQRSCENNDDAQSCFMLSTIKKTALATKFQSQKKVRLKECHGVIINTNDNPPSRSNKDTEDLSVFEKPAPRIIDEKFILLLLENLTLLSKNIPGLYKDINTLYLKLKKKHEKVVKNSVNTQGLSLLGKIYSDNNDRLMDDNYTQYDTNVYPDVQNEQMLPTKETTHAAINTTTNVSLKKTSSDKSLSVHLTKDVTNSEVQTKSFTDNMPLLITNKSVTYKRSNKGIVCGCSVENLSNNKYKRNVGTAISNSNCFKKQTKDCGVCTVVKYSLDNHGTKQKLNITCPLNVYNEPEKLGKVIKKGKNDRKQSPEIRENLIKEISLLSPSFKVSTMSQTDKMVMMMAQDKNFSRPFKIYKLLVSHQHPTRCSSATDSFAELRKKSDDLKTIYRCNSVPSFCSGLISPTSPPLRGPQAGFVSGTPGGRLASWIIESGGPLENASRELGQAQLSVQQLQRLLHALELQQQVHHDTDVSLEGASPNVKKDRRKFGLRKKKSNSKCASVELAPPQHIDPSSSHMAISALTAPPSPGGGASSVPNSAASLPIACAAARPQSLPGAEALGTAAGPASLTSLTPDHQLREDFTVLAKDLVASLKTIVSTLVCERGRLRAAMDAADTTASPGGAMVSALRTNLTTALQQNSELRSRLSRIHDASDLAEISSVVNSDQQQATRQFRQSLSYSSSCVSASEFFDAEEHDDDDLKQDLIAADEAGVIELDGDSTSEAGSLSSEEGSASSDNSDVLSAEPVTLRSNQNGIEERVSSGWTRRTCLPCPRPTPGGPSLWNLLYKNIGKDLSQISMPVTINEPLNMLQRLCEELEYSELLDAAAACVSGAERLALVATFAVSAYAASAHRAASKPFNPLLGETYECLRSDRGFRFLAEQVSHHPPISACHAESPRWCFWQEARIKTKFWGKSMEFQPTGRVHVRLNTTGDHYTWNKVTTCVHNLFGGQRWVDQYGEMHITCVGTDFTCKLNFIKASSWSGGRHEVRGAVCGAGNSRLRLQGRWSEALYAGDPPAARCLWRPGAMPPDHELYYGFTRFAMELNEIEPGMREMLPHTDTRFRPDQRALEEGDVEAAEQFKHELEQAQRERRRDCSEHTPAWFRKTVEDGEETWVFTGEYWKAREAGFSDDVAPALW